MKNNTYLHKIQAILPRILAFYDNAPTSKTYGLGDRRFWAWKLVDFPNATFQGSCHGLATLISANLLPWNICKNSIIARILSMVEGVEKTTRPNGSLEEAFPYESSFGVTALIAHSLICTKKLLNDHLSSHEKQKFTQCIETLISFISKNIESHGIISNHLAVGAAALIFWEKENEKFSGKGQEILEIIYKNQSKEGWYKEYTGSDPGYSTLTLNYLGPIYKLDNQENLRKSLEKYLNFIKYCIHPDGSFGGAYGSRNTRFFYPAGFEMLADEFPIAKAISDFMRISIKNNHCITISAIDDINLIPMFNSYALAAKVFIDKQSKKKYINKSFQNNNSQEGDENISLPSISSDLWKKYFPEAGLFICSSPKKFFWIATKKGGAWGQLNKKNMKWQSDWGALWKDEHNNYHSGQEITSKVYFHNDKIFLFIPLKKYTHILPSPMKFIFLRILNLSLMRFSPFSRIIKKLLVKLLIVKFPRISAHGKRVFDPWKDKPLILDRCSENWKNKCSKKPFYAIHMASQGYWQVQDDQ